MEVVSMPLSKIIPYVNNPKVHPPEQVKLIASSIQEFGFKVPIIIDRNGVIIAGHGRYEAARRYLRVTGSNDVTLYRGGCEYDFNEVAGDLLSRFREGA